MDEFRNQIKIITIIRRFLIPSNLRQAASLEKEAIIIGVGTRLEIWNKETWLAKDEEISADEIAENMTMLGI